MMHLSAVLCDQLAACGMDHASYVYASLCVANWVVRVAAVVAVKIPITVLAVYGVCIYDVIN